MTGDFFRFPHTPHLLWLGAGAPRDDKVLDARELAMLLAGEVVVEEKVDGANVGLSLGADGSVLAQNRGRYIGPGDHPQFGPLWPWIDQRRAQLAQLGERLIVFGEWCFAQHSVHYDQLPDWMLGFDVYDRSIPGFWASERRNQLFATLDIKPVPGLARGLMSIAGLCKLLEQSGSRVGGGVLEGVVVRRELPDRLIGRAKLVRREFSQQIEEHWSRQPLRKNALAR